MQAAEQWELVQEEPRYDDNGFERSVTSAARRAAVVAHHARQEQRWEQQERYLSGEAPLSARRHVLTRLVRGGVPSSRRGEVWPMLLYADALRGAESPSYFRDILDNAYAAAHSAAAERQIEMDVRRTFPTHRSIGTADGAASLRSVLVAYARRNPAVGYVQGMGFLAALPLIFTADAEAAFWCLCAIVEHRLPPDYYTADIAGARAEIRAFAELVDAELPALSAHMLAHGVVAELFAPRWFVALFAPTLPIQTTLRVWDAFCLDGLAAIHRVGLALLRIVEGPLLACDSQAAILLTMQREHARCHDVDRLFQLAFDGARLFLPRVPRARLEVLRAKARQIVAQEGSAADGSRADEGRAPEGAADGAAADPPDGVTDGARPWVGWGDRPGADEWYELVSHDDCPEEEECAPGGA